MNSSRSLLLLIVLFASAALAHEDRVLTVHPDGTIPEIPASLGHVTLKISGLGTAAPSVQFRVGSHVNNLPVCATRFITSTKQREVFVTGSWYHNERTLPYYVNVQFRSPGYSENKSFNSSVNYLFNLHTSGLIEINRFVANASGNAGQWFPVKLPKGCMVQPRAV